MLAWDNQQVRSPAVLLLDETAEKVRCTAESETPSRCKRI
jgi:hypothetical protein